MPRVVTSITTHTVCDDYIRHRPPWFLHLHQHIRYTFAAFVLCHNTHVLVASLWFTVNIAYVPWIGKAPDNANRLDFGAQLTMEAKTLCECKPSHVLTFPSQQSSVEFLELRRTGLFLARNTPWATKQFTNAKRAFTSTPKITPAWSAWLLDSGAMAIILLHVWVSLMWSTFNLQSSLSLFKDVWLPLS